MAVRCEMFRKGKDMLPG